MVPDFVFSANGKAHGFIHLEGTEHAAEHVQRDDSLVAFNGQVLKLGAAIRKLQPVVFHQGPAHETRGDIVFVFWMDVLAFTEVDDDRLAGVGQLQSFRL